MDHVTFDHSTSDLLSFLDLATSNIKSALERPARPRRKVNHRRYLQKQFRVHLDHGPTSKSSAPRSWTPRNRAKQNYPMLDFSDINTEDFISIDQRSFQDCNELAECSLSPAPSFPRLNLEEVLGPESPLEDLLSSPSWKQIVADAKNPKDNVFHYPDTEYLHVPHVVSRPSCELLENENFERHSGILGKYQRPLTHYTYPPLVHSTYNEVGTDYDFRPLLWSPEILKPEEHPFGEYAFMRFEDSGEDFQSSPRESSNKFSYHFENNTTCKPDVLNIRHSVFEFCT